MEESTASPVASNRISMAASVAVVSPAPSTKNGGDNFSSEKGYFHLPTQQKKCNWCFY